MTDLLDVGRPVGPRKSATGKTAASQAAAGKSAASKSAATSRPAAGTAPTWLPLVLRGTRAAITDIGVSLVALEVLVLVAWAADSRADSSAGQAVRLGASLWLVALHTRVHIGAAVVGIPPLLITLACALLVARSTSAIGRDRLFGARRPAPGVKACAAVVAAVAVPYAIFAAAVARVADTPTLYPSPATAAAGGLVVAGVGGCWGIVRLRHSMGLPRVREGVPADLRTAVSAGLAALSVVGVVALVLAAALLVAHHRLAGQLGGALSPGIVGSVIFTLLQVLLAPLLVVGAASWLIGPGFAVGAGTSVTPWTTSLGPVPAVPMLAALPEGPAHVGSIVLLVPVLAGVLAGILVLRRQRGWRWWRAPVLIVGAAAVSGVAACLLAYAAGGPAGPARLLAVGPSGWRVGLALFAEVAGGGLLAAGLHGGWTTRQTSGAAAARAGGTTKAAAARMRAGVRVRIRPPQS